MTAKQNLSGTPLGFTLSLFLANLSCSLLWPTAETPLPLGRMRVGTPLGVSVPAITHQLPSTAQGRSRTSRPMLTAASAGMCASLKIHCSYHGTVPTILLICFIDVHNYNDLCDTESFHIDALHRRLYMYRYGIFLVPALKLRILLYVAVISPLKLLLTLRMPDPHARAR